MALPKIIPDKKKGKTKKRSIPRTVQQSIPLTTVFKDGMVETEPETYTRMYMLNDINFKVSSDDAKKEVFTAYERFIDAFPVDVPFQIIIRNYPADSQMSLDDIRLKSQHDNYNTYRQEVNRHIYDRFSMGRKNLAQEKYVVTSTRSRRIKDAVQMLNSVEGELKKNIGKITKEEGVRKIEMEERLKIFFDIFNQKGGAAFYTGTDTDGKPVFDLEKALKEQHHVKNIIAPSGMEFRGNSFMLGETYGRILFLGNNLPNELSLDFMSDLSDSPINMIVSVHHRPIDMAKGVRLAKDHVLNMNRQLAESQDLANRNMNTYDLIPPTDLLAQKQAMELLDDVTSNDQKLYNLTFTVCVFGDSMEDLDANTKEIENLAGKYSCSMRRAMFQQEQGLITTLPFGLLQLEGISRLFTTLSASAFLPYSTMKLHHKGGILYGAHEETKDLILFDRKLTKYGSALIFGVPGSGKSYMAGYEMVYSLLRDADTCVYVIDPEGEKVALAKALGGEVINLSPKAEETNYINPLDLNLFDDGETDPVGTKTQYIISMVDIMLGPGVNLTSADKAILIDCCRKIYEPYVRHVRSLGDGRTIDTEASPTLSTLYNELNSRQDDPDAVYLAKVVQPYAQGHMISAFAHKTSVNPNSRFVVYNIKNLGSGSKDLGLHVCIDSIWNKMMSNAKKGIWTMFYVDEMHVLFRSESATSYLAEIWKRARKWKGIPTGITQNTNDLRGDNAKILFDNTSFVIMMSLSNTDQINLSERLGISEELMEYVDNSASGHGLLYMGKRATLPFNNEFPRDTKLHELLDTNRKDLI